MGIRVVRTPAETVRRLEVWRLGGAPLVEIGLPDRAGHELHVVTGAIRLDDGRIAVANGGTDEIRFYDADGRFLQAVGRTGEGPEEFRLPNGIYRYRGDSLVVWDERLRRFAFLTGDGRIARVQGPGAILPPNVTLVDFSDRTALLKSSRFEESSRQGRILHRSLTLWTYALGEMQLDSVLSHELDPLERIEGVGLAMGTLLAPTPVALFGGGGRIYFGSGEREELEIFSTDGRHVETIRWSLARRVDVEAEVAAYKARILQDIPETHRARFRRALEERPVSESLPAYESARRDRAGYIWVKTYTPHEDRTALWLVIGPRSRIVARAQLPSEFEPYDIGSDYILGKVTAELGIERIHLYPLLQS